MNEENKTAVSILECQDRYARPGKRIKRKKDGSIEKTQFLAGRLFKYRREFVDDIYGLFALIQKQEKSRKEFIIRGTPTHIPDVPYDRRLVKNGGIIRDDPTTFLMVDLDKLEGYPAYIDPRKHPEDGADWARNLLDESFRTTVCAYQYSSSQCVPKHIDEAPPQQLSLHLFFILDRAITSAECRRFFKSNPHVDLKLYNAAQPHFVAAPEFIGMEDPLSTNRSGILE